MTHDTTGPHRDGTQKGRSRSFPSILGSNVFFVAPPISWRCDFPNLFVILKRIGRPNEMMGAILATIGQYQFGNNGNGVAGQRLVHPAVIVIATDLGQVIVAAMIIIIIIIMLRVWLLNFPQHGRWHVQLERRTTTVKGSTVLLLLLQLQLQHNVPQQRSKDVRHAVHSQATKLAELKSLTPLSNGHASENSVVAVVV